ncbi:MAG: hypothetical protein IKQ83_04620 [Lachnospiraceae bacterium]|nr:hypothetical protein [Lachnospiraceae bacterium]
MAKKNLGNKAVLKAIKVGLAAVMATAQPMMVLAADGPDDNTPSTGSTELKDVENGVADAAQTAAGEASSAIGVNDPTVKTDDTAASKSCDEAASAVLADLNAGEAKAASTAVAPKNEEAVKNAAQALADDETIEAAAANVEDAKDELIKAENAVVASNEAAEDVVDNAVAAANVAVAAESEVNEAIQKADELIKDINNAPNEAAARQAYAGVQKLVTDTTNDLALKKQAFESYSAQYATARQELLNAESTYNGAMSASSTDAANAKAKLEEAQAKVEALEGQVNAALSDINKQNKAALTILAKLETVEKDTTANWNHQRDLFKAILQNYPGMVEDGAKNIKIENFNNATTTVNGDCGKYHYFKVTYKVNNETRVKYYNYDREDKTDDTMDGASNGIIIYEKTQEEIDATIYLKNYLNEKDPSYGKIDDSNRDDYTVFTYKDANGATKYILKKELANSDDFVSVVEDGKTVYYAKNGEGVTDVKVTEVAAPSDDDLKALSVGGTKSSLDIDEDSETVSYYLNDDGELVKEVKGDYVSSTYTKEVSVPGEYSKERPTNVLSEAEKNALITKVQADLALALPEGQSVTLKFAEVKDAESNDTYYKLTGSYVPLFKVQINYKDIDEFADDNDGSSLDPYWVKTGEYTIPIINKTVETGYYTAPILTNHTSEKIANGYNTFLQRIKDAGYTVTTNNLQKEMYDDGYNYGCEEIYIWGNIEYTKDGVAARTGIESGEYTSLEAALEGLNAAIQNNLATDGVDGDLTVRTIDHLGEAKTVKVLGVNIPYWYDPYDVVRKDKTFTATESYTNVDYTTDSYKKYAAYVEYVKAVVDAAQEGQVLSETTYANAERMLEVMQNKNNKFNGGSNYLDVKNDEDFNKFINDAKNLLAQYKGYQDKVTTAKTAVAEAESKVATLQTAIGEIDGTVANQRVTLGAALTKLQIPEKNWAQFLGLAFERNEETGDGVVVSDLTEDFVINEGMFKEILNMPVKDALEILDGILKNAESKLGAAEANLEVLNGKLTDAGTALSITLDRLAPGDEGEGDDDDDTTGTPGIVRGNDEGTNLTGTFAGGAGAGTRNAGRGNAGAGNGNGNVVTINNGQVPLANGDGVVDDGDDVLKVDGKEIKDSKTPLAAVPVDEQKTSLWWLALAALAAATGAGSYKYYDNVKKKRSVSAKNTEE